MNNAAGILPNLEELNPRELKALIVSQHELIVSRDSEIEQLKLLIAKLRRMQFGRSSEKLDRQIEQLELRLEELQTNQAEKTAANTPARQPIPNQPVKAPVRRSLPDHLPRETRKCMPQQKACPDCGGALKQLGEDVSEVLEYVQVRFKVIRQVRPKCKPAGGSERSRMNARAKNFRLPLGGAEHQIHAQTNVRK